jgi:hypothetical protein
MDITSWWLPTDHKTARIQLRDKLQQEFAAAIEQLVNQVLARLPERSLIEALNQALKLDCEGGNFLFSWGGVRLSPLGTLATNWPIVPDPDDG